MSCDDAASVELAMAMHMQGVVDELPGRMEVATKDIIDQLVQAARETSAAARTIIEAHEARAVNRIADGVAAAADQALRQKVKIVSRNALVGAAVASVLLALVVGGGGWWLGRGQAVSAGAAIGTLAGPDALRWQQLIRLNPEIEYAMTRYCTPRRMTGPVCYLPVFLGPPTAALARSAPSTGLLSWLDAARAWLAERWVALVLALTAGLTIGRLRWRRSAT